MKLAVGERNVATNLGTISGCVIEYCFSTTIFFYKKSQFGISKKANASHNLDWNATRLLKVIRNHQTLYSQSPGFYNKTVQIPSNQLINECREYYNFLLRNDILEPKRNRFVKRYENWYNLPLWNTQCII